MKIRRTRVNRVIILWAVMFFITVVAVAQPTGYRWGYWVYGLIWGIATSLAHYLFRNFFEEVIERQV